MCQRYNKLRSVTLLLLCVGVLFPSTSFAQGVARGQRAKPEFCVSVDGFSQKIIKDITERDARISNQESTQKIALDTKLTKQDETRTTARLTSDDSLNKVFVTLESNASTTEEKAAVAKFKKDIEEATRARRIAVDMATTLFKKKTEDALKLRKSAISNALNQFKNDAESAVVIAKGDCTTGTSSLSVRSRYLIKLETVKKSLIGKLAEIKQQDNGIKTLVKERQSAIERAAQDFKNAVLKAENELKQTFPGA